MPSAVSCIIPAFNEGPRIAGVLAVVCAHPLITEVIVVDDGSRDDTVAQVAAFPDIRLICQDRNRGKAAAIAAGLRAAQGEIIVQLDSDLIGLDDAALEALIAPVLQGKADASISLRGNAPWPWRKIGLDYISGERAMRRHLAPDPAELETLPRFGVEVRMNDLWLARGARLCVVSWPHVASPFKHAKCGWIAGLWADAAMLRDLAATVAPLRLLRQILRMRRLRVL